MLNLVSTNEPEVTVIPRRILLKVKYLLEKRNIPYTQVNERDFEEDWPGGCIYRGTTFLDDVWGIVAPVTRESLFKAAEDMWHMSPDEIE